MTGHLPITTNYLSGYSNDEDLSYIFERKIVKEKETKLKEFNFKLLHGISSCKKNLYKWNIRNDDKCDVCNQQQSIQHLLWDCEYVRPLWEKVKCVCDFPITYTKILGIDECYNQDNVLTIVTFLIYKEWLLLSLDDKRRRSTIDFKFYKQEITMRHRIYELCSSYCPTEIAYMNVLICSLSG